MWRVVLDGVLIFLIPFALFAGYRAIAERDPKAAFRLTHGPIAWLSLIGLLLVISVIVVTELRSEKHPEGYQRAIWKDGKLIQGGYK